MSSNIREFEIGLEEWADFIDTRVEQLHRAVSLEALRRLVRATPVDTGRARANWQVSHDAPRTGELEATDKGGGRTINAGAAVALSARPYSVTYLVNNLDYIEEIMLRGRSKQAPPGMFVAIVEGLRSWLARQK